MQQLLHACRTHADLTHAERRDLSDQLLRSAAEADASTRAVLLGAVIEINRPIAVTIARRYANRGVALDDLEQAACEGLVKAVYRFEFVHDQGLLAFVVPTVRGEVMRYFRDHSWMVRPPRRVQELQATIRHASTELAATLGREPTPTEVRAATGTSEADYDEAATALGCFTPTSLDLPVEMGSSMSLGDLLAADTDEHSYVEARILLGHSLRELDDREATIVYLRFFEQRRQQEIADELGTTQATVSRAISQILRKLRSHIERTNAA